METAQMMIISTARTTFSSNQNHTDDLDDTLPVELLDCIDTTTNVDWLTRDTPLPGKRNCAPTLLLSEEGSSSLFNPPLCSTGYKSDGSSEYSDVSTTAECGSACDDEVCSAAPRDGQFISSQLPAASVEFQPLRCSTAVTTDVVQKVTVDTFKIRVDTDELESVRKGPEVLGPENIECNPLRCSTGIVDLNGAVKPKSGVQRNESLDFKPLRCSTGYTNHDAVKPQDVQRNDPVRCANEGPVKEDAAVKPKIYQRNESMEFNPLRCSTGLTDEGAVNPQVVQRNDFNNVRCSTGLKTEAAAAVQSLKISPASPEEFYVTARSNFSGDTGRENDTADFVTALGTTEASNCSERKSVESAKSPAVQVSESQISAARKNDDVDNDLSILMQCHLKIRNGGRIVSNVQAKPQIELSLFKNSQVGSKTAVLPKPFPSTHQKDSEDDDNQPQITSCGLDDKLPAGKIRLKLNEDGTNFQLTSGIPKVIKLHGSSNIPPGKSSCGKAPSNLDCRRSSDISCGNRLERAMDNLTSANIQKVLSALATLDSVRSAFVCETLVQRGLIGHVYEFLSKMNRSIAHQVACVHATSLLLDLAKYTYSKEAVWQNGERIGLLFNLMLIWASKDNAIFLNCTTVLWVFCQDEDRANVLRRFVASQNKLLEKISAKLGAKILRPTSRVPTLQPSWTASQAQRTYERPYSAFSELNTVLKLSTQAK